MTDAAACCTSAASSNAANSTRKERDAESGNDYFGARYYSSAMGRWMSPDWSGPGDPIPYADFRNPQTLNLYSYVSNNPLRRTDPDGHHQECTHSSSSDGNGNYSITTSCTEVPDWWQFQGTRQWLGRHHQAVKWGGRVVIGVTVVSGLVDGGASELLVPEEIAAEEALLEGSEEALEAGIDLSEAPTAEGPELQKIIDQLYKPTDTMPGGTAGAARQELATGENVGGAGKGHFLKAIQRAKQLEKGLANGTFRGKDAQIARALMNDLRNAVTYH